MRTLISVLLLISSSCAFAWGNEGHEVVALIAWHYLSPTARSGIATILPHDNNITTADFAHAAIWADAYRDSDRDSSRIRYERTRRWHYVNLEITHPDLARACFGSPPLQPQQKAADGPGKACIIDKIDQFSDELRNVRTAADERLLALKFLIHLVGDLHQPLHAADNNDRGGNEVRVSANGIEPTSLHHYWDSAVISQLGRTPEAITHNLIVQIDRIAQTNSPKLERWRSGAPRAWALEALNIARNSVYARLPSISSNGTYLLDPDYVAMAKSTAAQQLMKAGLRLSQLLEQSLAVPVE